MNHFVTIFTDFLILQHSSLMSPKQSTDNLFTSIVYFADFKILLFTLGYGLLNAKTHPSTAFLTLNSCFFCILIFILPGIKREKFAFIVKKAISLMISEGKRLLSVKTICWRDKATKQSDEYIFKRKKNMWEKVKTESGVIEKGFWRRKNKKRNSIEK